jgi:hypothetical protein
MSMSMQPGRVKAAACPPPSGGDFSICTLFGIVQQVEGARELVEGARELGRWVSNAAARTAPREESNG